MGIIKDAIMKGPDKIPSLPPGKEAILNCSKHGEYKGCITKLNGMEIKDICPECLREEAEEDKRSIHERRALNAKLDVFNKSAIPPKYRTKTFNDYLPTHKGAEDLKALMMRYANNFKKVLENGVSFFFIGTTGTGKTHVACSVAMQIIRNGHTAMYTDMIDIPTQIKRSWSSASEYSEHDYIEGYVRPDLLIMDEVGLGQLDQKEKRMIFSVIKRRYEEGKPSIYISNYTEQQAQKALGSPAIRRMTSGGGKIIHCNWGDYTEKKRGTF